MKCQWFLLCENDATQTRPHPVLGAVPVCDGCAAWVDAMTVIRRAEKDDDR